jgi:exonuclease SbcC
MHLRTLTLQAIGPFTGRHTIDFAELGASGLFLLEGPTGAGKSTLIDAVVFALYGKVASEQASDERLRATGADPETESFVDLVAEVPSGGFRIRRTPQYERAKRRGEGTTTQAATVRAWRLPADVPTGATPDELDAYGEPIADRPDEVGAFVQGAIGLDRAQFVQTVVLPQGEFASFLRAKPEDRRVLLQKIFGTQVYEALAARLVELRREANQAVEAAQGRLAEAVSHLVGAARLDDESAAGLRAELDGLVADARTAAAVPGGPDPVGPAVAGARAAVEGRTAALAAAAVVASDAARVADAAWEAARTALAEATATAGLLARRDALRAEQTALEADAGAARERRERLDRARAAAAVRPLLAGVDTATAALAAADDELAAALAAAPDGLVPAGGGGVQVPAGGDALTPAGAVGEVSSTDGADDEALRGHLDESRRAAVATAATLDRLVALEAGLPGRRSALAGQEAAVDRLRDEVAAGSAWLEARPAERKKLVGRLEAARALAATLAAYEAAARQARERLAAYDELDLAAAEQAAAEEHRTVAYGDVQVVVEAERHARLVHAAGLAGDLAATLVPGEPCPVCGSTQHPVPAGLPAQHVTLADVEAAEHARAKAEDRLRIAAARAARASGWVDTLRAQVGVLARDQVETALAAAEQGVAAASSAGAQAPVLADELDGFDAATAERDTAQRAAVQRLTAAAVGLGTAREALAESDAEVEAARDGHPAVAARHAALVERAHAAEGLLAALGERDRARSDAATRAIELAEGAMAAGFGSPDEARAALLTPDELAGVESEVARRDADVARVAAGLAEPAIAVLPDGLVVDLPAATQAERAARLAAQEASGVARLAVEAAAAATASGEGVVGRARTLVERVVTAAPIVRLAGLASGGGDNGRGVSLGTYVLMRRFEDVVAAANERLLVMSDGRYSLVRSDEKEDVRARSTGLAMRVVDHWTDQQRDPRTLSGGETFYVSLCLALGLADVVTAEAGGIDLGTLFVDEGFGSLDPHVLDQVLAELGKLRAGGRTVGVVSHVEALKQAIADRVEVRPRADGSSTLTVRAG